MKGATYCALLTAALHSCTKRPRDWPTGTDKLKIRKECTFKYIKPWTRTTTANNILMSQDWIFWRQTGQQRVCGRLEAGSPANRSLSSSEWTPLDLAGVLAASSLNRSAASSLARSGWETPRLTAARLLCSGGGAHRTDKYKWMHDDCGRVLWTSAAIYFTLTTDAHLFWSWPHARQLWSKLKHFSSNQI